MDSEEKKYYEVSLAQILKFRPYRKLLFCIYLLFSHENITEEEIQQNLNNSETFQDFKRLVYKYQTSDGKRIEYNHVRKLEKMCFQ